MPSGRGRGRCAHALAVGVGGRTADMLAVAEGFFVFGEDLDAIVPQIAVGVLAGRDRTVEDEAAE